MSTSGAAIAPDGGGEYAVIGLGKSGRAAAELLARQGVAVYASDAGSSPAALQAAAELRAMGVSADVGAHDLDFGPCGALDRVGNTGAAVRVTYEDHDIGAESCQPGRRGRAETGGGTSDYGRPPVKSMHRE